MLFKEVKMKLWKVWYDEIKIFRSACSRNRTFHWMITVLVAFSLRSDIAGVTSFIRSLGFHEKYYSSFLNHFHTPAVNLVKLRCLWIELCFHLFNKNIYRVQGRFVAIADGLKNPKEGRKMPAVRSLHQESDGNTKPEFIMGHYFECISLLVHTVKQAFAVPLVSKIHDGVIFDPKEKELTLIDKFVKLVHLTFSVSDKFILVADAYYAAKKLLTSLTKQGNHMITRMRSNAVAWTLYEKDTTSSSRGRPRIYGEKFHLRKLFQSTENFIKDKSPVYGEESVDIQYRVLDLVLRPFAIAVRIILVIHPTRGKIILLCTDRAMSALEIIKLYGFRFKIEVSFRHAIRVIGVYGYHFWMMCMKKISKGSKSQHVYQNDERYQAAVIRKIKAYETFVQLGLISQGMLIYLSVYFTKQVWTNFGSWLRTMKTDCCPSELVVSYAMRNTFWIFLQELPKNDIWKKFFEKRAAPDRLPGLKRA